MRSLRHLVYALLAALALTTSQAVPLLHGLAHHHHHDEVAPVGSMVENTHRADAAEIEQDDDHDLLHCTVCARLTSGDSLPLNAPVAVLVVNVATEPNEPTRDITQPIPRLYVTSPPDQPRAPPAS